jgi:hypothetical protein
MIARLLGKLDASRRACWLRRSITQALALNRTEVRPDGLRAGEISLRLAISWRARDVHPWDHDLVGERRARRLMEQTFLDTEAALERLFVNLPEVDLIDFKVLETDVRKDGILMSGSISRLDFETWHPSSTVMRLKLLGVHYKLVNLRFVPLDTTASEPNTSSSEISSPHANRSYMGATHAREAENGTKQAWHQDKAGPH